MHELDFVEENSIEKIEKKNLRRDAIIQASLELFSERGFHRTTIPDIAKKMAMSAGNLYNYFSSKSILAKEIIKYTSGILGKEIEKINQMDIPVQEKIRNIVEIYFKISEKNPEQIDYFLRVYLANREVFQEGCEGMICVSEFMTELMIFFEEGVSSGQLRDQDFFSAFGLFMGYLGGMVFLKGEGVLPRNIESYIDEISLNIYAALRSDG